MRDKDNLMDKPGFWGYLTRVLGMALVLYSSSAFASEVSEKPVKPKQEQKSIEELRKKYADMCSPSLRTVTETGKKSLDHRFLSDGTPTRDALYGTNSAPLEQKPPTIEDIVGSCKTLRAMACVYDACGEYNKAEPLAEKALNLAKTHKVPSSELSACMLDLVWVYKEEREFDKAQPLCEKGIELQKKGFFEEYGYEMETQEDAYALRILTSIYKGQGKFKKAESALNQALEIMLRLSPPLTVDNRPMDGKLIPHFLKSFSLIYKGDKPNLKQQIDFTSKNIPSLDKLDQTTIAKFKYNFEYYPFLAPFFVDTARLQVAQGNFKEAEAYYLNALDLIDGSYGPEHLYTARVKGDLAELYAIQGRYPEAEPLINNTLEIQEGIYGPEHHLMIPTLLTKARIYQGKGEYNQAEELFNKSLTNVRNTGIEGMISKVEGDIAGIRAKR